MTFPLLQALRLAGLLIAFFLLSGPLCAQWQLLPGPSGGKVTCWAESPGGDIYAGGTAGIFKSADGGKTWEGLTGNAQIGQLPTELDWDEGNLYMSTQAYNVSGRALWKSTDDGATWVFLRNDLFDDQGFKGVFDARHDTIAVNASPTGFLSIDGGKLGKPASPPAVGTSSAPNKAGSPFFTAPLTDGRPM